MATALLLGLGPGSVVGGEYTIRAPLEEGGMGAVYVAEQRSTGKLRALKLMHREIVADPALQRRFEQEARVASRIRSEHVVDVLAAGVDGPSGLPYLVMELLEGKDLRHHVDAVGALPHEEIRAIYEQLCHAMAAAHEGGVVHRDLKPENVFLARSLRAGNAAFTVKVLDFGIAKIEAEAGTRATKGAVGSPLWMAPEQTAPGPITPAADVWALGLLAYELVTGKSFWRAANSEGGTTAQLLREIVLDPIPAASTRATEQGQAHRLPVGFDAWFARCVEREPGQRYADAGVMWRALATLLGDSAHITMRDALAETFVAPPVGSVAMQLAAETGDATSFAAASVARVVSAPPVAEEPPPRSSKLPAATPLESVQEIAPPAPPPARSGALALVLGGAIAALGIGVGVYVARGEDRSRRVEITSVTPPVSAAPLASAPAPVIVLDPPAVPAAVPSVVPSAAPPVVAAPAPRAASSPAASASAAPKKTIAGGFGDPSDRNGAVTWKVQDRHVRLFTRLVSNESNVADAVVKKAVEWSSWEYLRCYERVFGGAKDFPEGSVTVGFDILDQLPRHAALVSSTIASDAFNDCVVRTLVGQTINAAGPDGKGHVVHAFRFVPN